MSQRSQEVLTLVLVSESASYLINVIIFIIQASPAFLWDDEISYECTFMETDLEKKKKMTKAVVFVESTYGKLIGFFIYMVN